MKITIYELLGKVKDEPDRSIYVKYFDRVNKKEDVMWACKENIIYKLNQLIIELNDEAEILEEGKELHANDIEFNINNDKRDCIITLDENDLGIDKLHLDNCYFYKENDKWYVKKYDFKNFNLEEEKKVEFKNILSLNTNICTIKRYDITDRKNKDRVVCNIRNDFENIGDTINELIENQKKIIDYLKSKGDK